MSTNHHNPTRTLCEDTHFRKESLSGMSSGYTVNRQHWDGSSWKTEANQHTDLERTSYRLGYNQDKPFHKVELRNNDGRYKSKERVYDVKDKYTHKADLCGEGYTY